MFHVYRMGGALQAPPDIASLPVIDANETVHDIPEMEPDPPAVVPPLPQPPFPDVLDVITEDDLIGKRASIAYEDCLKQLTSFLVLPLQRCPYTFGLSQVECQCRPPFEVSITYRGTASIMEWVSGCSHTTLQTSSISELETLELLL